MPAVEAGPALDRPQAKLKDVALLAKVSTATVSRALTTPDRVGVDALQRVRDAVRELGYLPHGAARALRSRRTRAIGAVIPTLDNAIFAHATQSLQKALEASGHNLFVACHEFDLAAETRITQSLIERGVDGVVLVGLEHEPMLFDLLDSFRVPYVLTWAIDATGRHPSVGFRNREAAARVARYLLDIGHRSIAMIAGETGPNDRARERVRGVHDALASCGVALDPAWLIEAPYTFDAGREAMRRLCGLRPRPTAVICGNDVLAIGAINEALTLGLQVPAQISVTGFDDLPIASLLIPSLTTVRVPMRELGSLAAQHLLALIAGEPMNAARELPVELIVRDSTAPPGLQVA